MNFDLEKTFAKVAGENVERFAEHVVSNSEKMQIDFAFEQLFQGLSTIQWIKGGTLGDAWKKALDQLRDFIFSIEEQNFIIDYLHMAVFEFRDKTLRLLSASMHINEVAKYPADQCEELKKAATEKIQKGIDIIKNILAGQHDETLKKENINTKVDELVLQKSMERQHEYERERVKK